jgi:hypothetical protein
MQSRYRHTSCTLVVRMVLQSLVEDLIHESERKTNGCFGTIIRCSKHVS